jgi:DNA modification methylase
VWTDPPYGVAIASRIGTSGVSSSQARADGREQLVNDDLDQAALEAFLRATLTHAYAATRVGGAWYVAAPHGPIGLAFCVVLTELGVWRHSLVWVKDSLVLGRSDYHYRHEPIYYGWKPGAAHRWFSDRKHDTVLQYARPRRSAEHPTMKPVDLIADAVQAVTTAGDLVLDLFAGSGSTLIACHQTGRVARLVELDPRYADVICRRWQAHTGEQPTRDGRPVDFLEGA